VLPAISSFENYRQLLEAVLSEEKLHFSTPHKSLAQSLGLSPSHLSMILDGKRNLSFGNLLKLSQKLKCTEAEFAILEALFMRDNSKETNERDHFNLRLTQLKSQVSTKSLRTAALPKISSWHILPLFVYITDFVKAVNFEELFHQCAHLCLKFDISENQLKSDLELLHSLEVLQFSESDKVHLRFDKLTGEFSQIKFMQNLVSRALHTIPTHFTRSDSHFSAEAITLSGSQSKAFYQRYKELIAEFVSADRSENTQADVVMITLQMLPLEL
jgi:uncharacterized protein (TIGR02147 family)